MFIIRFLESTLFDLKNIWRKKEYNFIINFKIYNINIKNAYKSIQFSINLKK